MTLPLMNEIVNGPIRKAFLRMRFVRQSNHSSFMTDATGARFLLLLPLLVLVCLMSACGEKQVARVQTEGEAIEIVDRLRQHGLEVEKEEGAEDEAAKWHVTVNEGWFGGGEVSQAVQVMHYYGLPRAEANTKKDDSGMFPSPSVENAQRLREREADMERKLRMLPGVARVNVTVVLPEDDTIKLDPYPATASVLLVHEEQKPAFTGEQIQSQVAGGVPGLKPEKVTVTMSYEPPPVIQQQDLKLRRRNNLLLAAGIGLVTLLCFLVGMLVLQSRRQRAELIALREGEEVTEETEEEETTASAPLTSERARLGDASSGAGGRPLPRAATGNAVEDSAIVK
jgi:type III secretory pathway lipoprotein EscJ